MFNFRLFFHLIFRTFSFSKLSLRFPSVKRILVVLIIFPIYLILLLFNYIFLFLDELFFPAYRHTDISKAIFITGVPRSATTYVLSLFARDIGHFTCFKFWELMFAPSILQKYIFNFLIWIDSKIGHPVKSLAVLIDRIFFGRFRGIHDIGLTKPEEDEVIFMYSFTSAYLSYFFPEIPATDKYLLFDDLVPENERKHLMRFYSHFVQRHNYVFNRNGDKYFLSKNPSFVSKLRSVSECFPHAKFIYLLRSPYKTIPSTISLNAHIYAATCRLPESCPLIEKTRDMLANWYKMADNAMKERIRERGITINFRNLIEHPKNTMLQLYHFLGIDPLRSVKVDLDNEEKRSRMYKSPHAYDKHAGVDQKWIEEELGYLFPDEIRQQI